MQQAIDQSRRRFFRGRSGAGNIIRPPWSLSEERFLQTCQRCDDCITHCETGLLKRGEGGFPESDFINAECTFCEACVNACSHDALQIHSAQKPWHITARIQDTCLAQNKVHCRTCAEQCEKEAIHFQLAPGGIAHPIIDTDNCNGCGACASSCPVSAIKMRAASKDNS